jgi:hypothetical protein
MCRDFADFRDWRPNLFPDRGRPVFRSGMHVAPLAPRRWTMTDVRPSLGEWLTMETELEPSVIEAVCVGPRARCTAAAYRD